MRWDLPLIRHANKLLTSARFAGATASIFIVLWYVFPRTIGNNLSLQVASQTAPSSCSISAIGAFHQTSPEKVCS